MNVNFIKSNKELKDLNLNVAGPQGCIVSNRITVDGFAVGFCFREPLDPKNVAPDSGWRFFAGDEDEAYTSNPANAEVMSLNTVANYDSDIIPLLNAPHGSAFERDENGKFIEIIDFF